MGKKRSTFLFSALCFGMAFLYIPILLLIVYSFNYSKLVPVWGGFSFRWYGVLFQSALYPLISPLWRSPKSCARLVFLRYYARSLLA